MTDLLSSGPPAGSDLDDRLGAFDRFCAELARAFRGPGALIDHDPDAIKDLLDLPGLRVNHYALLPPAYRPRLEFPADLLDIPASSALGWAVFWERFAYGDPGLVLASPGPSLSGGVVRALGTPAQQDRYFARFAAEPTYTCFALTEPGKGSAVTELETTIRPAPHGEGWVLSGEKCYIGNGARAQVAVVFCRRAPGPLGIEAVTVDTSSPGFHGELLPVVGLRGARISRLRFDDVLVAPQDLLGAHLPPSRRGLRGALHILYRARPGIAAMALGCAQAACDYVRAERVALSKADRLRLEGLLDRIAAVRRLTHRAAADLDRGMVNAHRIGAVKIQAAHLAEEATLLAAELLGPASLIEHPWLEKTYRDVRAFELMEGTTNLHRLSVFQGMLKDVFLDSRATRD